MDAATLSMANQHSDSLTKTTQVSVAGAADITLLKPQVLTRTLELTGATQSITVLFPNTPFLTEVRNSTNFDLTLKRVGSSKTVLLRSGGVFQLQS